MAPAGSEEVYAAYPAVDRLPDAEGEEEREGRGGGIRRDAAWIAMSFSAARPSGSGAVHDLLYCVVRGIYWRRCARANVYTSDGPGMQGPRRRRRKQVQKNGYIATVRH